MEVGVGKHLVVKQNHLLGMGGNGKGLAQGKGRAFHLGEGGRPQEMVVEILDVQHIHGLAGRPFPGFLPGRKVGIGLVPVGQGDIHVHFFAGAAHIVTLDDSCYGAIGRILDAFPAFVRVQVGRFAFSLQQEAGGNGNLRIRTSGAFIVHQGGNHVVAGVQVRCQVHGLIVPVQGISLGRAHGYQMLIHIEFVTVVARYVHHISGRYGGQVHILAEIVHAVIQGAGLRHADPAGGPLFSEKIGGLGLGLGR